jgi:hypothetical protein
MVSRIQIEQSLRELNEAENSSELSPAEKPAVVDRLSAVRLLFNDPLG